MSIQPEKYIEKIEEHPKESSPAVSSQNPSSLEVLQMVFQMLISIGINLGTISQNCAKMQNDQATIADRQAETTKEASDDYLKKLDKFYVEQAKAKKWGIFGEVMKWVGVSIAAVVGALLCETGVGFVLLAGVIALTASGTMEKGISALGDLLGEQIGSSVWGKILAQLIVIAVVTVVTAGAEGISLGISKAATATSEGGEIAAQAAIRGAEEQIGEMVAGEGAAAANNEAASGLSNYQPRFRYAARAVGVQTICSSNLIGELVDQLINQIPGDESAKKWAALITTIILDLSVALLSFKGVGDDGFVNKFITQAPKIKMGLFSLQGTSQIVGTVPQIGMATTQMAEAETLKEMAPLESNFLTSESMIQIFTSLSELLSKMGASIAEGTQQLFRIDFSSAYKAATEAMNRYTG